MTDESLIDGGNRRRVQRTRVKKSGWTKARRTIFLKTLAETCNVTLSTERAGMSKSVYDLRRRDPGFALLWDEALAIGYDRLRADTAGFARDVAVMRDSLEGPLAQGAGKAAKSIETSLLRAVQNGRLGFDNLRTTALSALDSIASSALKAGVGALLGGSGGGSSGSSLSSVLAGLASGSPGRATGGPVSPGRAYMVGERGPELFVPTASGRIDTGASAAGGRDVRVAITINAPAGQAPGALQQSSRQVARAVRAALAD